MSLYDRLAAGLARAGLARDHPDPSPRCASMHTALEHGTHYIDISAALIYRLLSVALHSAARTDILSRYRHER